MFWIEEATRAKGLWPGTRMERNRKPKECFGEGTNWVRDKKNGILSPQEVFWMSILPSPFFDPLLSLYNPSKILPVQLGLTWGGNEAGVRYLVGKTMVPFRGSHESVPLQGKRDLANVI